MRERRIDVGKKSSPVLFNLTSSTRFQNDFDHFNKPIEIYVFVDPLCPISWSLESNLKKLIVEYGCYFVMRSVSSGNLYSVNPKVPKRRTKIKDIDIKIASKSYVNCPENEVKLKINSKWDVTLAIKAAELQGRKAGAKFSRKLQEYLFISKRSIMNREDLIKIAQEVKLDVDEFNKDLDSKVAKRALQADLNLAYELEIETTPAVVLFNKENLDDGLKVSGLYDYDVYVDALFESLNRKVKRCIKPSLEQFLSQFTLVGTKEVAFVFDWSTEKAEKELKKLLLSQKVKKIDVEKGKYWEYIG